MKITANIKKSSRSGWFGRRLTRGDNPEEGLVDEIISESTKTLETETVEIKIEPFTSLHTGEPAKEVRLLKSAAFQNIDREQIDAEYLKKVTTNLLSFLRDPEKVAKNLRHVDEAIADKMTESGLAFDGAELPQHLMMCQGYFMPGRPSDPNYAPKNKGRIIDRTLLSLERKYGLNANGESLKFVGGVSGKDTLDSLTSDGGRTFGEDGQVSTLSHHGKFSHRLHLLAILSAIENDDIDLSVGSNKPSAKDILNLLLKTSPNIWQSVIDNVRDTIAHNKQENADADGAYHTNVGLSTVSPFTLNSLILCFGKDVGLPNLQSVMLDSHYKQTCQMVGRLRVNTTKSIDMWSAYEVITEALGTSGLGDIGAYSPGTLTSGEALRQKKYQPTKWPGVVTKEQLTHDGKKTHASMEDYVKSREGDEILRMEQEKQRSNLEMDMEYKSMRSRDGGTILHSNFDIVDCKRLLELAPELAEHKNDKGQTALHSVKSIELADLLLSYKPEMVLWKDDNGEFPDENNRNPEIKLHLKKCREALSETTNTMVERYSQKECSEDKTFVEKITNQSGDNKSIQTRSGGK